MENKKKVAIWQLCMDALLKKAEHFKQQDRLSIMRLIYLTAAGKSHKGAKEIIGYMLYTDLGFEVPLIWLQIIQNISLGSFTNQHPVSLKSKHNINTQSVTIKHWLMLISSFSFQSLHCSQLASQVSHDWEVPLQFNPVVSGSKSRGRSHSFPFTMPRRVTGSHWSQTKREGNRRE